MIHVYNVLREHHGDKPYQRGDERELDSAAAQHLVALGVLKKTDRKASPPAADPVGAAESEAEKRIAAIGDRVKAAEAAAADQMGALDKRVEDARNRAEQELSDLRGATEKAMRDLLQRGAEKEAELQALDKRIEAAKAEAAAANKAEGGAPANKAGKA